MEGTGSSLYAGNHVLHFHFIPQPSFLSALIENTMRV